VLNWWGVQESATVSAVIATTAFVSDILIIVLILVHVPLGDIVSIFREIFAGGHLTGLTVLTGYAGAFLAFSGLESIAQLAPVMRVPRRKVVSVALSVVALTVGFTGPLLTIFSTVLLTDPRYRGTMTSPGYAADAHPAQFISLLGGAYGGIVLAVAIAITASALLIFASNTAIIGAYHVMLALARLRYFPRIVRRTDPMRHSPVVAIAVVTLIPIAVLLAVSGNINLLGELYGFGLLGAFSLMCISMDVIRWRERRGEAYIGAQIDPELTHNWAQVGTQSDGRNGRTGASALSTDDIRQLTTLAMPVGSEATGLQAIGASRASGVAAGWRGWRGWKDWRGWRATSGSLARLTARLRAITAPGRVVWSQHWSHRWPDLKYYLGFLTTALVLVAWLTNLVGKPLATSFGGGLTLLGLAIAILHYRYQEARYPVVFLDQPAHVPSARLVVLSPITNQSKAVIRDAMVQAKKYLPVFLYLAPPSHLPSPRIFEIRDQFGMDEEAQVMLSRAKRACNQAGIQGRYLYAVGGATQLFDLAARVRPDEIVAEEHTARRITYALPGEAGMAVSPTSVRYRRVDGTTVAHYVLHDIYKKAEV